MLVNIFFNQPATDINSATENLSVLQLSKFNILTECTVVIVLLEHFGPMNYACLVFTAALPSAL